MKKNSSSQTAMIVAAGRAGHSAFENGVIFNDHVAHKFLKFPLSLIPKFRFFFNTYLSKIKKFQSVRIENLTRAAYNEAKMLTAIKNGTKQILILGAGMDSFICRYHNQFPDINIYEIDHPNTQNLKKQFLKKIPYHPNTNFVSVNFENQDWIKELSKTNFDFKQPVYISWLGVSYYLKLESLVYTFKTLFNMISKGSQLILDYGLKDTCLDAVSIQEKQAMLEFVRLKSEPMLSFFEPEEFKSLVENLGWIEQERITTATIESLFLKGLDFKSCTYFNYVCLEK
ncbi:MAG: SAM-dependent methyltransferase [Alphaproteobacteria bacterium]|nr:SAM-dependent methyltransferase [Alphaproteobacteria bacterium]